MHIVAVLVISWLHGFILIDVHHNNEQVNCYVHYFNVFQSILGLIFVSI
jgi:hypothetical protein